MKTKGKIIVYIATSADGYIARPDGDVEWLNRRPRNVDYGMKQFYPTIDTILLGVHSWFISKRRPPQSRRPCRTFLLALAT